MTKLLIPGLDDLVWGELRRMRKLGRLVANAGDVYKRLRRRLRKVAIKHKRDAGAWDVVSVLGSMLRFAGE